MQVKSKRFGGAPIAKLAGTDWGRQFFTALEPDGDADDSDGDDSDDESDPVTAAAAADARRPSITTYVLHYVSITWKLVAAFVPPPGIGNGIPAFIVSLALLGAVTYLIQEFAILFGCACGLNDAITAITYVALGTSLPDTFASRHACIADDDADGSLTNITGAPCACANGSELLPGITSHSTCARRKLLRSSAEAQAARCPLHGQIKDVYLCGGAYLMSSCETQHARCNAVVACVPALTACCFAGSNAVNVYLGLGIPWLIAAAYYLAKGQDFAVASDGITFGLILYLSAAAVALVLLWLKRRYAGGELGGKGPLSRFSFAAAMVGMWLVYIVLASYDSDQGLLNT